MGLRVAVDAMGGDHAPFVPVAGALSALADFPDLSIVFVGDEGRIKEELRRHEGADRSRFSIVHTSEIIDAEQPAVEALRTKKDSSIVRLAELAAGGEVDALFSAGNTGAFAAACQLKLRTLPAVSRAGIAVTIPSFRGPFVLCDVGANIQAKPRHLYDYALMTTLYAERVIGIERPRVGLVSIGQEKGTGLVKESRTLLAEDERINFVGNIEGRELFEGECEIGICDGFVGNIVLKLMEGLAEGLLQTFAQKLESLEAGIRGRLERVLGSVRREHDYSTYGGAPLLGIDGVCIIGHGRSNRDAVRNALGVAHRFVTQKFNQAIMARLAAGHGTEAIG